MIIYQPYDLSLLAQCAGKTSAEWERIKDCAMWRGSAAMFDSIGIDYRSVFPVGFNLADDNSKNVATIGEILEYMKVGGIK